MGAVAAVEDIEWEASGEAIDDFADVGEGVMDFRHIAFDHDVGEAAGGAEGLDIIFGGLGVALVAEGEGLMEKEIGGFGGDVDESIGGERLEEGAGFADAAEIFAKDGGADLGDGREFFVGAMIEEIEGLETGVGLAEANRRKVRKIRHEDGKGYE